MKFAGLRNAIVNVPASVRLGFRLHFFSSFYCICGQVLRRKASWCKEEMRGLGLRLEYHILGGSCIFSMRV